MRVVNNVGFREHTSNIFFENKVLKIYDMYKHNLAVLMFQKHSHELPPSLNNLFRTNSQIHDYPTRQSNHFHLPITRTALMQDTFLYTGPKFWNSLPKEMQNIRNLSLLKIKLKKNLLSVYEVKKKKK